MKPFIASLYALFLFAMISGIAVAFRNAEGLVETDYYEKGRNWFQTRSEERRLDLNVGRPGSLSLGSNDVRLTLTEHGRPLGKANVKLFVGNVSTSAHDASTTMQEVAPGVYQARAILPLQGKWLVRMDLAAAQLNTSRSWFYDVR